MKQRTADVRFDIHLTADDLSEQLRDDVRRCFDGAFALPPRWFYDERGCALFDRITELDEYYPTRRERSILRTRAAEIAERTQATTLVELGSGSSEKTHLLLEALQEAGTLRRYVPFDVSLPYLRSAAPEIAARYGIDVHAVVGDFEHHVKVLPIDEGSLVAFLGSTIGNLDLDQRAAMLEALASAMPAGAWFLLGADLVKDEQRLVAAYDDADGVTAEFNRNVLRVMNDELAANFEPSSFEHVARWNPDERRIEIALRVLEDTRIEIPELGIAHAMASGDELQTEISCKFRVEDLRGELRDAGFDSQACWTDPDGDFAVLLSRRR